MYCIRNGHSNECQYYVAILDRHTFSISGQMALFEDEALHLYGLEPSKDAIEHLRDNIHLTQVSLVRFEFERIPALYDRVGSFLRELKDVDEEDYVLFCYGLKPEYICKSVLREGIKREERMMDLAMRLWETNDIRP